ncbi:MAG: 2-hydroxychromene-2-carboxylate isomerase [Holophagales bacterium]|nr:2-hydroxychromene-2-carboxylate isomerase [Holophagales bacterium]MYG30854.1 2-hydroxychromene-2-carboxylate isomerase [Holophagales bacterium]MYI80407.1 2-hydroxychromene-2-carboxylate isomerase [Holophagales bacterium]
MSIKSFASKQFSTHLLDERRRDKARARAERERRRKGEPHRIEFFNQVDDPYSHLLAQALVELQARYEVEVVTWLVEPPEDWAAPARALLESYSLVDARRLAEKAGFHATSAEPPDAELVLSVQRQLTATLEAPEEPGSTATLEAAVTLGKVLWSGEPVAAGDDRGTDAALEVALRAGTERRADLGHYLGGTCFYGGEWTWGIDRLAYLEERLADLGAEIPPAADAGQRAGAPTLIYAQPRLLEEPVPADALEAADLPDLHFFASFRSPYTWISTERVIRLAEAFGVNLRIRFVLPMVMRGLPVKRSKRVYILLDAAREARRNGVQFGPISDPVGKPVECGYSLLPWAIEQGRGIEYFRSFMTLVFSQAVDAGSDRGLRRIVEEAGLDWGEGRGYLDDPAWREEAERNREELFDLGLWGVPSFRVGSVATWGQDRLWVLEDEYRRLALRRE